MLAFDKTKPGRLLKSFHLPEWIEQYYFFKV